MERRHQKNEFLNIKSEIDMKVYKKQEKLCITAIGQAKKEFSDNIFTNEVTCETISGKKWIFFLTKLKLVHKLSLLR